MKILNLYSCLGGNRYKWDEVADIEVTAVELDPELARLYQGRFPKDNVIVTDAHEYLLENYQGFDFIWSSPPCPTHSRARFWRHAKEKPIYPDMKLYQEIIFLKHHFKGLYCVENVIPYYEPFLNPVKRDRHLYWSNFPIPYNVNARHFEGMAQTKSEVNKLSEFHDYDFRKYKGKQRTDKIARNLVDYQVGKAILDCAIGIHNQKSEQLDLF